VTRRRAYALVIAVCAVPRLVILFHERGAITASFTEKSDTFAQTFVQHGTFGFIPGEPSAYTQPLYGWFLVPIYWIFGRHWLSIGLAQIVVACVTAVLVYEIGRRFLRPWAAVLAACVATLQPYLVWHDVHVNREILDQLCAAGLVLLTLLVAERRTRALAVALGIVTGLAMLGNSRLVFIPIVCALYLLARRVPPVVVALVLVGAAIPVTPWLVRNEVDVGCFALTTDGRALWKANNPQTYRLLSTGSWIDNVSPDSPRPAPPNAITPEEAWGRWVSSHGKIRPDPNECVQMSFYEHLAWQYDRDHPGGKAKLAALSEQLFWQPNVIETGSQSGGFAKQVVEPVYMWALYVLAAVGLFVVPRAFLALALVLFAYESLFVAIFVGATRYRIAFDFLLALLAAAAVQVVAPRLRR
jgi:4-amino-4-deoxy-L-arabinose transferase-like glycosyltransferase